MSTIIQTKIIKTATMVMESFTKDGESFFKFVDLINNRTITITDAQCLQLLIERIKQIRSDETDNRNTPKFSNFIYANGCRKHHTRIKYTRLIDAMKYVSEIVFKSEITNK